MGAFLVCWLPFFSWYLTFTLCGDTCHCPDILVSALFWIGNRALLQCHFYLAFQEKYKMLFLIKGIFPLKTLLSGRKFSGRIFITYSTKLRTTDLIIIFLSHLITEYDMTRHSAAMNHDNNTNKHYTLHITQQTGLLCGQITNHTISLIY